MRRIWGPFPEVGPIWGCGSRYENGPTTGGPRHGVDHHLGIGRPGVGGAPAWEPGTPVVPGVVGSKRGPGEGGSAGRTQRVDPGGVNGLEDRVVDRGRRTPTCVQLTGTVRTRMYHFRRTSRRG